MIRFIPLFLLISSCSQLPIAYMQNFSEVNKVIFGFPDYEITQEVFDSYDYSFAKVQFDRGPHSILILAYIEGDVYEWVGNDNVRLYTQNGRVIKTIGLLHDFEIRNPQKLNSEIIDTTSYESIDLYEPDFFGGTIESTYSAKKENIRRFGTKTEVLKLKQVARLKSIAWKAKNSFYLDEVTGTVVQSKQKFHPRLTEINIEFYYKF